jgi:tetratricopeptide (TPR) repeat protein
MAAQVMKYDKVQMRYYPGLALAIGDKRQVEKLREQALTDWQSSFRGVRAALRYPFYFRGYIDLKEGRTTEALMNFKEALKHSPLYWAIDSYENCLAKAYLEANLLDEAIAEYDRLLRLNPCYPLAHYDLARAYELKGEREQARSNYERFLEVWKTADADIPQLIDARQRLTALQEIQH